jgi:hypothetical protein
MTVKSIIEDWLKEGRTAWIASQGLHPFALLDLRVHDLAMAILEHVTEAQASPTSEGLLDTRYSIDKQMTSSPVETISSAKETQAAAGEGPLPEEMTSVLKRA